MMIGGWIKNDVGAGEMETNFHWWERKGVVHNWWVSLGVVFTCSDMAHGLGGSEEIKVKIISSGMLSCFVKPV